ncbi:MAG TPA: hypothetical protein VN207_08950 [Ktedonobacteraceae bacterium]|nr:hypothetical protein [Ktedonobacteraceae bacterium]
MSGFDRLGHNRDLLPSFKEIVATEQGNQLSKHRLGAAQHEERREIAAGSSSQEHDEYSMFHWVHAEINRRMELNRKLAKKDAYKEVWNKLSTKQKEAFRAQNERRRAEQAARDRAGSSSTRGDVRQPTSSILYSSSQRIRRDNRTTVQGTTHDMSRLAGPSTGGPPNPQERFHQPTSEDFFAQLNSRLDNLQDNCQRRKEALDRLNHLSEKFLKQESKYRDAINSILNAIRCKTSFSEENWITAQNCIHDATKCITTYEHIIEFGKQAINMSSDFKDYTQGFHSKYRDEEALKTFRGILDRRSSLIDQSRDLASLSHKYSVCSSNRIRNLYWLSNNTLEQVDKKKLAPESRIRQ